MLKGTLDPRQVLLQGYETRCEKILKELLSMTGAKFIESDEGFAQFADYTTRIPNPMSIATVRKMIQGKGVGKVKKYKYLNDFALDVRRIFANFVRYNYFADATITRLRRDMSRVLLKFEQFWYELHVEIERVQPKMFFTQPLPELKHCLAAFDDMVKINNSGSQIYAIDSFINPIHVYLAPTELKKYTSIIKNPISVGEIVTKLIECEYESLDGLKDDLDIMVNNCSKYWSMGENAGHGETYIRDAMQLQTTFLKSLTTAKIGGLMPRVEFEQLPEDNAVSSKNNNTSKNKNKGNGNTSTTAASSMLPIITSPSIPVSLTSSSSSSNTSSSSVIERKLEKWFRAVFKMSIDGVKSHYLVATAPNGNSTKVKTAFPFAKAVDPVKFPEYAVIITDPMDLSRMEKKLNGDRYTSSICNNSSSSNKCTSNVGSTTTVVHAGSDIAVCMILNDITLLRDNAHTYNTGLEGLEVRIMADCVLHYFKYLLRESLRKLKLHGDTAMANLLFSNNHLSDVVASSSKTNSKGNKSSSSKPISSNKTALSTIESLLVEKEEEDVTTYLRVSGTNIEQLMHTAGILKLMGITGSNCSTASAINGSGITTTNGASTSSSSSSVAIAPIASSSSSLKKIAKSAKISAVGINTNETNSIAVTTSTILPASSSLGASEAAAVMNNDNNTAASTTAISAGALASSSSSKLASGLVSSSSTVPVVAVKKMNSNTAAAAAVIVVDDIIPTTTGGGGYPAEQQQQQALLLREKLPWESAADTVWRALCRHVFVDPSKPTVVADFMRPVAAANPSIAADYEKTIQEPMDLSTLRYLLDTNITIDDINNLVVKDAEHFFTLALRVFQNALHYNSPHLDSSYAVQLVQRCQLLIRYTQWISLETLPVTENDDATNEASSSAAIPSVKYLTKSNQLAERKVREDILTDWNILGDSSSSSSAASSSSSSNWGNPYTECKKLLKDLERCRNNQERIQLSFFLQPVNEASLSDYSVYIRSPIDLSTIKYRLDGTLPGSTIISEAINRQLPRYLKYGEFVGDLRRVFTNALKYNKLHLATDSTGMSQKVYDAALIYQERLEALLSLFTVGLADRVERTRIANMEAAQKEADKLAKHMREEEEAKRFEKAMIAELKATDHIFAADYDLEQKKKLTEQQLKSHILAQQRAIITSSNTNNIASMDMDLGRDVALDGEQSQSGLLGQQSPNSSSSADGIPAIGGAAGFVAAGSSHHHALLLLQQQQLQVSPLFGFGVGGKVPSRYTATLLELKKQTYNRAWQAWPSITSPPPSSSSNSNNSSNGDKSAVLSSSAAILLQTNTTTAGNITTTATTTVTEATATSTIAIAGDTVPIVAMTVAAAIAFNGHHANNNNNNSSDNNNNSSSDNIHRNNSLLGCKRKRNEVDNALNQHDNNHQHSNNDDGDDIRANELNNNTKDVNGVVEEVREDNTMNDNNIGEWVDIITTSAAKENMKVQLGSDLHSDSSSSDKRSSIDYHYDVDASSSATTSIQATATISSMAAPLRVSFKMPSIKKCIEAQNGSNNTRFSLKKMKLNRHNNNEPALKNNCFTDSSSSSYFLLDNYIDHNTENVVDVV